MRYHLYYETSFIAESSSLRKLIKHAIAAVKSLTYSGVWKIIDTRNVRQDSYLIIQRKGE